MHKLIDLLKYIGMSYKIIGDQDLSIDRPSSLKKAEKDNLAFCTSIDQSLADIISRTKARILICSSSIDTSSIELRNKTLILVDNPKLAFARILRNVFEREDPRGIHRSAVIHPDAMIGNNVKIGPHATIGSCTIGNNVNIDGNVFLYAKVIIGNNVSVYAGAVIGKCGVGHLKNENEEWERFPQIGGVVVEDDVEIGTNASIDRGTLDDTIIGKGCIINNLVHIGHNCIIHPKCLIGVNAALCGSVEIGKNSWISPGVVVRDGIHIGENVMIGMGSVVTKNIPDNQIWFGNPAKYVRENQTFERKSL